MRMYIKKSKNIEFFFFFSKYEGKCNVLCKYKLKNRHKNPFPYRGEQEGDWRKRYELLSFDDVTNLWNARFEGDFIKIKMKIEISL